MCGALATRPPCGIEQRARVVEALADVDRLRRCLQHLAHLLGDVHEEVVEDLDACRVEPVLPLPARPARRYPPAAAQPPAQRLARCQPGSSTTVLCGSTSSAGPASGERERAHAAPAARRASCRTRRARARGRARVMRATPAGRALRHRHEAQRASTRSASMRTVSGSRREAEAAQVLGVELRGAASSSGASGTDSVMSLSPARSSSSCVTLQRAGCRAVGG